MTAQQPLFANRGRRTARFRQLPAPTSALVGVDEAGLGPTLGPYVVAAAAVEGQSDPSATEAQLRRLFVSPAPGHHESPAIELGDSKQIHSGAHKLKRLERTALAGAFLAFGTLPNNATELLGWVCPHIRLASEPAPWLAQLETPLPVANSRRELEATFTALKLRFAAEQLRLTGYCADLVSAHRFNSELGLERELDGTKNTWATRHLAVTAHRATRRCAPSATAQIVCDRAGGRQTYSDTLTETFGSSPSIIAEDRTNSVYRIGQNQIEFRVRADASCAATAWASCLAKYLRELVMDALNHHFGGEFRRCAGYPQDAARFIREVYAKRPDLTPREHHWIRQG